MKKTIPDFMLQAVSIIVFLLLAMQTYANGGGSKIIALDESLYSMLDMVYVEAGLVPPSGSRPWSINEWEMHVSRLEGQSISSAAGKSLAFIAEELQHAREYRFPYDDAAKMDLSLRIALEGYAHTNLEDFPEETDWHYDYTQRRSLLKASMELSLSEWFYLYMDIEYKKNRFEYDEAADKPLSENIYNHQWASNLFGLELVDFETPYRAFISLGRSSWNLSFGRDKLRWGHGQTGNFVIHDHLDFHDSLRFVSFHDRIKFEASYLFFEHSEYTDRREVPPDGVKMFFGHRIELRPFPWFSFAVTENIMYQHDYVPDFRFLNPAYIFHNLNNRSLFNAIASFEAEISPVPKLNLYYQFSLFQARAPLEGDSQPDAMAHLAGYRTVFPMESGYVFHNSEFLFTDPYMYHRDGVDYIITRRQFVIDYNFALVDKFMGYPEGSDALVVFSQIGYRKPGTFEIAGNVQYVLKGEIGIEDRIEHKNDFDHDRTTPSGTVEKRFSAGLEGTWNVSRRFELYASCCFIRIINKDNVIAPAVHDFQVVVGASLVL